MSGQQGILAIFNNIAPGDDELFQQWFQHEHLEERLAVPGFLLGRRYEAVSGDRRFFNFYVTQSPEILRSAAYLARVNDPTPLTKRIMSEVFRDMIRTVCERVYVTGHMRGSNAVTVRFHTQAPDDETLREMLSGLSRDPSVACGEIWRAVKSGVTASEEERLRGGDGKIEACLLVETTRSGEAESVAKQIAEKFPQAAIGIYRLLCEIKNESR